MIVGASTCIVLTVAALKSRGKITGVVRPLEQPHHYSKLLGVQDAMNAFSSDGGPRPHQCCLSNDPVEGL
jgi:hypothetical protein